MAEIEDHHALEDALARIDIDDPDPHADRRFAEFLVRAEVVDPAGHAGRMAAWSRRRAAVLAERELDLRRRSVCVQEEDVRLMLERMVQAVDFARSSVPDPGQHHLRDADRGGEDRFCNTVVDHAGENAHVAFHEARVGMAGDRFSCRDQDAAATVDLRDDQSGEGLRPDDVERLALSVDRLTLAIDRLGETTNALVQIFGHPLVSSLREHLVDLTMLAESAVSVEEETAHD